ncbi:hypothetical protein SORBI_3009G053101 [Sorghum bicolor]|uniref:Uncharacterized protein n=1 Tax=Sorghum bicolor TaxID=4558 RepID=A0A1Z5R108_SORBI|nr:hypothetical protein SORBI_3009G053101 [Sorghum bicolor]
MAGAGVEFHRRRRREPGRRACAPITPSPAAAPAQIYAGRAGSAALLSATEAARQRLAPQAEDLLSLLFLFVHSNICLTHGVNHP